MGTPQGQGIVPRDGPRAQPVVPGFFSDVGKVQIEPFPLLQSIPHLCTCTSPQNLVWGITVPPKKLCQKPSVGQDPPPITDLLCQEQWHRLGSLVIYDAKNCFKYQRKQKKWPKSWVILSPLPLSQWKYKEGRKP